MLKNVNEMPKTRVVRPEMPFATPFSSVERIPGTVSLRFWVALEAPLVSTPASSSHDCALSSASVA